MNERLDQQAEANSTDRRRDVVIGSLIGDALALGPHWIYDQNDIDAKFESLATYHPPKARYHVRKGAGDHTHYGDQALVLLRSIARNRGFRIEAFSSDWQTFWEDENNPSYRDGATRETLENLQSGKLPEKSASGSRDLAGASRMAPLFLLDWPSDEALFAAARCQTLFTHGDPAVIETSEFFARVVLSVLRGESPKKALSEAAEAGTYDAIPDEWLEAAVRTSKAGTSSTDALAEFGLTCHVEDAFPGVCHILLAHAENPVEAFEQNNRAGGDTAARGMVIGMVLGAYQGVASFPAEWIADLRSGAEAQGLISEALGLTAS